MDLKLEFWDFVPEPDNIQVVGQSALRSGFQNCPLGISFGLLWLFKPWEKSLNSEFSCISNFTPWIKFLKVGFRDKQAMPLDKGVLDSK